MLRSYAEEPAAAPGAGVIQAKLRVSTPGDVHEQEANAVAERVMSMSAPSTPLVQGQAEGKKSVQLKTAGDAQGQTAPPMVHGVLRSPGQPLDAATRDFMEPRFGRDFSGVRVHTDGDAAESSRFLNAVAYTVGRDIVFGHGQYAPQTGPGRRLIAHELTHVVQQHATGPAGSGPGSVLQRQVADPRPLQMETHSTPRQLRISEWLVEPAAGGAAPTRTEVYWVDFEVDPKGVMRASVRTVSADRAHRSANLRFGDQFRAALQHFSASGVEVNAFEGDWSYMTKDEVSENLRVFRETMAAGETREKAARATPSGRVATRAGFEVVSVENVPESQEHLAEEGVRRWRVKALFRRTPAPPARGPVTLPEGGTTTGLPTLPMGRAGRGRLATVDPDAVDEFEGIGGGRLSGLAGVVVEVIGPMLEAFAWELVPALSNQLWEQHRKELEAEILQKLNSPDSLRRIADYQIDQVGLPLYGNVTVEIVTEDAIMSTSGIGDIPTIRSTSYYESSKLIDVQTSDKYIKRTTEKRGSRYRPGLSVTVHRVTETYSVAIPQLENRLIRARLNERIAALDREMDRSVSQGDNFSLQLLRDQLAMRLHLYQSD